MLDRALRSAEAAGLTPYRLAGLPVRNEENDLDFTLPTDSGDEYLDLMEIAVLPKGARGYKDAARGYHTDTRAREVFEMVKKKTRRYGRPRSKTHLLLYITDRHFELVPDVAERVTLALARKPHGFATVCYFAPDDDVTGLFLQLYPAEPGAVEDYARKDRERLGKTQRTWVMRGDLATATSRGGPIPRGRKIGP
jgi:hypothetical protein